MTTPPRRLNALSIAPNLRRMPEMPAIRSRREEELDDLGPSRATPMLDRVLNIGPECGRDPKARLPRHEASE